MEIVLCISFIAFISFYVCICHKELSEELYTQYVDDWLLEASSLKCNSKEYASRLQYIDKKHLSFLHSLKTGRDIFDL